MSATSNLSVKSLILVMMIILSTAAHTTWGANPASAGSDAELYTVDGSPGGKGYFWHVGESFAACDIQSDGYRVTTFVQWMDVAGAGMVGSGSVADADSANGNCFHDDLNIPEDRQVDVQVCLRDGAYGAPVFCNYTTVRS